MVYMTRELGTVQMVTTKQQITPIPEPISVNVKKAVALGEEMMKKEDVTKADVARKMFDLLRDEKREVVVQAFVDGASLTPKGASTYYYNCKRKMLKGSWGPLRRSHEKAAYWPTSWRNKLWYIAL